MSEKRRDNKNRILRIGEQQRADGRYLFSTIDPIIKKRKFVYSWKLERHDKMPEGKKADLSLREKEKLLERDLANGISLSGGDMTVLELVEKYLEQKRNVRPTTAAGYKTVVNVLKRDSFGSQKINHINTIDAKAWLIKLQSEDGKSYSSIHTIRGVVRPAFQMAYEVDLIRKNPFDFELHNFLIDDSVKRDAVTSKQEKEFLRFVQQDEHFSECYDGMFILFRTGLRIGDDDDKIRLNQRKPSKYKGLSRFGPEKNLQRINKFMKERPTFYKKLIQMKENFRFYLRCFYCITKVVILQFNSEKQDRISS